MAQPGAMRLGIYLRWRTIDLEIQLGSMEDTRRVERSTFSGEGFSEIV